MKNVNNNNYLQAISVPDQNGYINLFAVELENKVWSVSDGKGAILGEDDVWHIPVGFDNENQAVHAIKSMPHVWFDISLESEAVKYFIKAGGTPLENATD